MDQPFNKRAVFVGLARDCADILCSALDNVLQISRLFAESAFIFIENDSQDSTKVDIEQWCKRRPKARLISLDGLAASFPIRTIRLACVRNRYLSLIRSEFRAYDYLFVIDCDDANAEQIDLHAVRRAIEFLADQPNGAGVFANSIGIYYDLWALRHPVRCPGDVWEEVCDYALAHRVTDNEAYRRTLSTRIFSLPTDPMSAPLEVDSAFGGLGIYKIQSVLNNKRSYLGHKSKRVRAPALELDGGAAREVGWQCCEHVAFNSGFRESGEKLFVLPYLVNCDASGVTFRPSEWRTMLFDPRLLHPPRTFDHPNRAGLPKVGRNQACPCGSGRKYKQCHGANA
jgi:hypothetical protein